MNRHLVLALFCVMVYSGSAFAPFSPDTIVNDILDSTAFNVAMFAMGWAVTHWMKGTDSRWAWRKALPDLPDAHLSLYAPNLRKVEALQSSDDAETIAATSQPSHDDTSFTTSLLSSENEEASGLLAGLSSLLSDRISTTEVSQLPPWRRNSFYEKEPSSMSFKDYISYVHWFSECSTPCIVLVLVYLERALSRDEKIVFNDQTCRRLFLTSLVAALKFHDDDFVPYPNSCYADIGGVSVQDLNSMEKQFCKAIDWQFHVRPEEYNHYYKLIVQAAPLAPVS